MNVNLTIPLDDMQRSADRACGFLRSISHPQRLMVLCQLSRGERSVGDLAEALGIRQSTLSQQLARLRGEGLVTTRRDGTSVYYALARDDVMPVIEALYTVFCGNAEP
jgi:ArsR family transcriptional regulator